MCAGKQKCACGCTGAQFQDAMYVSDAQRKIVVSVRDGWQEYLKGELGLEPAYEVVRVWRSADTIREVAAKMVGLPIKDNHIESNPVIGTLLDAEVFDLPDAGMRGDGATIAIRHTADVSDEVIRLLQDGVREVSLDYFQKLIENDNGELESLALRPDFLAIVERGRCGDTCRFQDKKKADRPEQPKGKPMMKLKDIMQRLKDAEGEYTLEQIAEIVAAIPEAIGKVPTEKLKELMPALAEIVTIAKAAGVEMPAEPAAEPAEPTEPAEQMPVEDMSEEDKMKLADGKVLFSAKQVQDAAQAAIADHLEVVEHARKFLPEDYEFKGKDSKAIMLAALAAGGHDQKFKDHEIGIAFRLMKPASTDYSRFGDAAKPHDDILSLQDKEY